MACRTRTKARALGRGWLLCLLAALLCAPALAAVLEPAAPKDDTALYMSYPYGSFAADALRFAGGSDAALIDNASVEALAAGQDVSLGRAVLERDVLLAVLERAAALVRTDSEAENVCSAPEELGGFLQLSGLYLTYDSTAPAGARVTALEDAAGTALGDEPRTVTASQALLEDWGADWTPLDMGARAAVEAYLASEPEDDWSAARIRVLGTVDGTIVSSFPRWVVIAAPLAAALLVCQSLLRNRRWRDAHGVFLRRRN